MGACGFVESGEINDWVGLHRVGVRHSGGVVDLWMVVVVVCVGWHGCDLVGGGSEEGGECRCVVEGCGGMTGGSIISGGGDCSVGCGSGGIGGGVGGDGGGGGSGGGDGGWCGHDLQVGVVGSVGVTGVGVIGGGGHSGGYGGSVGCDGVGGGLDGGGGGFEVHGGGVIVVWVDIVVVGVVRDDVHRNWYCGCGHYCVIDRWVWFSI